jgi:hypothetical protein
MSQRWCGGVDTVFKSNAERFVAKYGLKHFLLYVGRKALVPFDADQHVFWI